ncbi:MAG: leucine-rich repeat protein, partial [Candidatus Methanomethylophilaceae archaeon]|nr:leucine-rich repeat protein [Candidatus Methanomethylophilaceae archaeon]
MKESSSLRKYLAIIAIISIMAVTSTILIDAEVNNAEIGDSFSEGALDYEVLLETPATAKVKSLNDPTVTDLVIPETVSYNGKQYMVTEIEKEAFMNNDTLTSVTIPKYVTKIGIKAFEYCKNISLCNFNAAACGDLDSSASLKMGCGKTGSTTELTVIIGDEVTKVPAYAFMDNYTVRSVIIGPNVTSIGTSAFRSADNLITLDLSNASKLESFGSYAFMDDKKLQAVDLASIPLKSIGANAFANCYEITNLTFKKTITTLGNDAFENCSKIESIFYDVPAIGSSVYAFRGLGNGGSGISVTFGPNVKEVPDYLFTCSTGIGGSKNNITSIEFSNNITKIGSYAFHGLYKISTLNIPATVTNIGQEAFSDMSGLTSITIPENVIEIGNRAFADCKNVTAIYYNAINCTTSHPFPVDGGSERTAIIGDKVTKIPANCFTKGSYVTSITIPDSVTLIEDKAFYHNYGMKNMSILGCPKIGTDAFLMSDGTSKIAKCNVYGIMDQSYYKFDVNGQYNYMQLAHVELDLNGTIVNEIPAGWGEYSGKLCKYYENGQQIKLPTLESTGKSFEGWTPSNGGTMGDSTQNFTAHWAVAHTVTYNTNGGSACPPASVKEGDAIPLPTSTRSGYDLSGWSIPEGTVMGTSNITVTAYWTPKTVTVTFMSDGNVVSTSSGQYGTSLTAPTVTKEGYTLLGWTDFTGKYPANDTTYTAKWGEGGQE